jgi:protein TonB
MQALPNNSTSHTNNPSQTNNPSDAIRMANHSIVASIKSNSSAGIIVPSIGIPKLVGSIVAGGLATFSLFVLMHELTSNELIPIAERKPITLVSSVYEKKDEIIREDRYKIKPPPLVLSPPERDVEAIPNEVISADGFGEPTVLITDAVAKDSKFTDFNQASDARPIVRINPEYPAVASRDGIEGWVELSFSIDESGAVRNVNVTNSEPQRIFDRAAKRALQRWKYQAKKHNGKAVVQDGLSVMLIFKISA